MAEQFIIRVQLEGQQISANRAPQPNTTTPNLNAGVPLIAASSDLINKQQQSQRISNLQQVIDKAREVAPPTRIMSERKLSTEMGVYTAQRRLFKQTPEDQLQGKQDETEPLLSARRTASLATATALRVGQAVISQVQHRSGNTYFNRQLQTGISTASTLGGLAITAAFNPVLAVVAAGGIAVSTTLDILTAQANYDYDRRMDTLMIHNTKEVSGNISYGRRGGTR